MQKNERICNGLCKGNKVDSHISGLNDWVVTVIEVGNSRTKADFYEPYLNDRHE